jgi:sulfur carrier protein
MSDSRLMQITVNGKPREVEAGSTVASLLKSLELDPRQLAVERNLELVPRGEHEATKLLAGDRLEVVTLVGGG